MTFGVGRFARRPGPDVVLDAFLAAGAVLAVLAEAAIVVQRSRPEPRPRDVDDDDDLLGSTTADPDWGGSLLHEATEHLSTATLILIAVTALLAASAVLLRRRWPWPATALAASAAVVGAVVLGLPVAVTLVYALVVYSLAVARGWWPAGLASLGGLATMLVTLVAAERDEAGGLVLVYLLVAVVVPLLSAAATRSRHAYLGEVEARLRRADREHEAQTARTLAEERVRLARDLHDVLAHSLTVVNMQVGVASHLLATHPDRAAHALDEAKAAGAAAVAELRTTLALLRGDEPDTLTPVPGLADIPAMVERVRATGLPLELAWQVPNPDAVDAAVGLLAFRVVQEGLTNVVKHAGAEAATAVAVRTSTDSVSVAITNAAGRRPPPGGAPGIGLEGLRARVAAVGGSFSAAATPGGGFGVHAQLPAHSPESQELP